MERCQINVPSALQESMYKLDSSWHHDTGLQWFLFIQEWGILPLPRPNISLRHLVEQLVCMMDSEEPGRYVESIVWFGFGGELLEESQSIGWGRWYSLKELEATTPFSYIWRIVVLLFPNLENFLLTFIPFSFFF